ncbi:AAA family ATPase [Rhizobium leguminosarum]|uniref:AAA family ATPase n=1 Tax=Rhizobium leguminosarum TaxID=384 RepID=A0AAJ1ED14_RHILE|nr:ATP-binding protein [Rhizobium leguminosarum]MBY5532847.1 AAA family ATPase [Rhizobium leguminosarum]MBY5594275.1 AAA family ATPase [Rhizobium leguminosarum]MBY5627952.1 AAA family ATPase [Rhizobium leguminosarum]
MATIRIVEIDNFRGIKSLKWHPGPGLNCLIGIGDSGKSTILDAIDLCLGARRTFQFTDADFHGLVTSEPISVTLTIGNLAPELKSIDGYGLYLRGFDEAKLELEDEPGSGLETVLSLNMRVESDLEPVWSLLSDRAAAAGQTRNLSWSDRVALSPVRIGALSDHNLSWRRGSILNRLSDETADASTALLAAAREARKSFGADADKMLGKALGIVTAVASDLGIDVGAKAKAELEAHSASVTAGTISLHDETGVPLRRLGIGSARLIISGLQQKNASESSILLVDELEHGLEPHRIIRFLDNLGAKQKDSPLQVFLTSHSSVAVRELTVEQVSIVRKSGSAHEVLWVGQHSHLQGILRVYPEAFLARSVLICEGASEVGLLRGVDQHRSAAGKPSMHAHGTCLVDAGGYTKIMPRARAFQQMGFKVATFRDDDYRPEAAEESAFEAAGGKIFKWRKDKKLEVELFECLPHPAIKMLVEKSLEDRSEQEIDSQVRSYSKNAVTFTRVQEELGKGELSQETRTTLGCAAGGNKEGKKAWFKTVGEMEEIGRDVVWPNLEASDKEFKDTVIALRRWCIGG